MTLQIDTTSPEDTLNLAAKIGARLRGGEVIELVSDLGGGKTVFVRGLAKGMGSDDQVASPTFTISREYKAIKNNPKLVAEDASNKESSGRGVSNSVRKRSDSSNILWLHHFDFYRLNDAGVVADELAESVNDPKVAVVIEWSGIVKGALPKNRLTVDILKTGYDSRSIKLSAGESHEYLIEKDI